MKKLLMVAVLGVFVLSFFACGGGGDAKSVMRDYLDATKSFVESLKNANDAPVVVTALNSYSDKMEKLVPKMKALSEKYPELKTMGKDGKLPEAFKEFEAEMKEVMAGMMGSFANIGKFAQDPKVMEANKRFMKVMSAMK